MGGACSGLKMRPGAIRRKQYDGGFGFQRLNNGVTEIQVVYDPENPDSFQPAGLSYVPGAVTGVLFLGGMVLVLQARRAIMQRKRARK